MIVYDLNNIRNLNICAVFFKNKSHGMDLIHPKLIFSIMV